MPVARIAAVAALVAGLVAGAAAPASSEDHKTKGEFRPMDNPALVIEGKADLDRTKEGTTEVRVKVRGLEPGKTYMSHLHTLPCASRAGHYQNTPGDAFPPNELWISSDPSNAMAGLTADEKGKAKGKGVAPWTARPDAQSVVIHDPALPSPSNRIACADLTAEDEDDDD